MTQTLNSFFKKLAKYFVDYQMKRARWMLQQQTIRELHALSDKELNDIGINRGMIRSIAMEGYFDNRDPKNGVAT